jgi:hypothetical protein
MFEVFPLAGMTTFAPALLAGAFLSLTSPKQPAVALGIGLVGFFVALIGLSIVFGVGAFEIGRRGGQRADGDIVQFVVLSYAAHALVFFLVGGWIVKCAWTIHEGLAVALGLILLTFELYLLTQAVGLTSDFLKPKWVLPHLGLYLASLLVTTFLERRSRARSAPSGL